MTTQRTKSHTPGPWHTEFGWVFADPKYGVGGEGCTIAQLHGGADSAPHEDVEANTNLIAAAPDLLAACKALSAYAAQNDMPEALREIAMTALSAINKAEGRN